MAADSGRGRDASRDVMGLMLILLIALALRVFAWSQTAVMFNDGPIFLAMAEAIGEGRWAEVLAHPYHPLYPALIAIVGLLPFELETAAVTVSILGGLLGIVAIFHFARDAFGDEVAWLAAWIVALHPWAVDFSADIMSDGLYMGLFLAAFAAMASAVDHPKLSNTLGCGVASGLAYLVRPEGAGLLVACTLLLVGRGWVDRKGEGRWGRGCAALLLSGALVILPLVAAVGLQTGEFVLTQKKSISKLMGTESRPSRTVAPLSVSLPLPEFSVLSDGRGPMLPPRTGLGFLEAILRVVTTSMAAFRFELIPFAIVGVWGSGSKRKAWRDAVLGLPVLLYGGLLVLLVWGEGYVGRRHVLVPWLPVVAFSALGWRTLCARLANWGSGRRSRLLLRLGTPRGVALCLVSVLVLSWGARDVRPRRFDRAPVRVAAEWLAENHPKSGPVAAQKLRTAYYAGAGFVPLPSGLDGHLAEILRWREARWVVIDDSNLNDHMGLKEGIGRWLHRVYSVPAQGRNILVLSVGAEPAS